MNNRHRPIELNLEFLIFERFKPMENVDVDSFIVGGTSRPVKIRQGQADTDTHRLTQAESDTDREYKTRHGKTK